MHGGRVRAIVRGYGACLAHCGPLDLHTTQGLSSPPGVISEHKAEIDVAPKPKFFKN